MKIITPADAAGIKIYMDKKLIPLCELDSAELVAGCVSSEAGGEQDFYHETGNLESMK
jgi:hypothetical protein